MSNFGNIEQIQASLDSSPFNAFCQIQVVEVDLEAGKLVLTMPMHGDLERMPDSGQMHGGPIASLIDIAGCYASMMVLEKGVPTINFRVDYFRPVIDTGLRAEAIVRRVGRSVSVADVDIFEDSSRLVAVGRATYSSAGG